MKKILIFCVLFFMPLMAFAGEAKIYKLKSGQTVVIQQVKSNPIVTIDTWIKTGSIDETDKNNGVAHFLEHLFFKGSSKYPVGEFDRLIESQGGETNAATSKDFTHYYITIPSDKFDMALDLHSDMLLTPQIPQDELTSERKVVIEEISKDLNSPRKKLSKNLTALIYKTHPYKREVIGKKEVIANITREEIFDFYNKNYGPQNMITLVVGDVEPEATLKKVEKAFANNNKVSEQKHYKQEKRLTKNVEKIDYDDISTGYLGMGYNTVSMKNKDTYALDVLAVILGQGRSSRFYQDIKENKQLAYSITCGNSSSKDDGLFIISANFQPENVEKLRKEIDREVQKIKKYGIDDEDLNFAKSVIEKDTAFARESITDIATELGYTLVVTGQNDYYDNYVANIKKVTTEDVRRVANKYLNYSATSILLPKKYEKEIKDMKIIKNTEAKFVKEAFGIKKYTLENKATLLVNQNDANEIVAISINARGGEFLEKIAGTGFLTSQLMTKGTKKYSFEELSRILEENGINIVASTGGDNFAITVLTTRTQLNKALEILDEIVNNANFKEEQLTKDKASLINNIKKSRDIPLKVALENYKTMIFKGSPYSNTNKILEKTVPTIKLSDIQEYYDKIFYPENIVIGVTGNVNEKELVGHFTNMFNGKKGSKFDFAKYSNAVKPITKAETVEKKIDKLQTSWYFTGWQTSGVTNKKEYATLQVINSILGGGMSSRLFRNVRDKEGLAYQIGSSYAPQRLKGQFMVYIGTNPKTLKYSEKRLLEEVYKLKTEPVSAEELKSAKEKLIGGYYIALETNLDKASTISNFEASSRGFEFIDEYKTLVNAVTAQDVMNVAKKYFNDKRVTSIVNEK